MVKLKIYGSWSLDITRCRKSLTNSKNRVLLKTRIADCKRDDKDKITRFSEVRGSQWCPNNSLLKASSTAKQRCETELKKDSFEARSSIVMVNIVTVEKQTKKIMQGTTEAVDVKNIFLQDVKGPTSYHFSNGPSLNRILVFQDHVGNGEVRTFLNIRIECRCIISSESSESIPE